MTEKLFVMQPEFNDLDGILAARESASAGAKTDNNDSTLRNITKEDILRRIEEDRERHKRLRESLWVVPANDDEWEFQHAWDNTSDLCDVDFEVMREEMALHRQSQST